MNDLPVDRPKDLLIELLQGGGDESNSGELLGRLSEEERLELDEARQAMHLLEQAKPAADRISAFRQQMNETADEHRAATQGGAAGRGFKALADIRQLGHYEILETLGQGGFGIVVKARDARLGRIVALKIPRIDSLFAGQDARDRFVREARLVAMLSHPAIVPIYESGSDGPLLFIASSWCNAGSLASWFSKREKKVPPQLAAKIVARLAEAAQHAHARGVIHRDLKPGNVLLDFSDGHAEPDDQAIVDGLRITDFGLAKLLADDPSITQTGATIGTPAYMSPEQARGAVDEIGPTSDVYALGAIFYELLTGRPPIVGESNMATMRAIETQMPTAPQKINQKIPADLAAICLKCLEKSPRDRYPSAQYLEDDLRRFNRGEPVNARPIGPLIRVKRWSRRNPATAAALSLAFASLAIGLALSIGFGIRASRATRLAIENRRMADKKSAEALTQAKLARGAVDRLQRAIASEPKLLSEGMEKFKLNLATSANEYYQLISTQQPDDRDVLREFVDTLRGLAYLLQLLGNHEDSAAIWQQAADIMRKEFPDDLVGWAALRSKLAEDKLFTGKTREAVEIANEIVTRLKQTATETGSEKVLENLVFQLVNAAQALNHRGSPNQADQLVDEAIGLVNLLTGNNPTQWPANRIWARVLRCKTETAIKLEQQEDVDQFAPLAIELYSQVMIDEPSRTSEALDSMASMHQILGTGKQQRGLFNEAIAEFEHEERLMQQLMTRHPDAAWLSFNWSNHIHRYTDALFMAGRIEEADRMMAPHLDWLRKRQDQYPQLMRMLSISEVECRGLMSKIDARQGRMDASSRQLATAIEVCELECGSDEAPLGLQAFLGNLYTMKAKKLLREDKTEPAKTLLKRAVEILEPIVTQLPTGDPVVYLQNAEKLLQRANER